MKKVAWAAVPAIVLAGAAAWFLMRGAEPVAEPAKTDATEKAGKVAIGDFKAKRAKKGPAAARERKAKRQKPAITAAKSTKDQTGRRQRIRPDLTGSNMFADFKPEDRKLVEAVQAALDDNNFEGVKAAVRRACESSDPEVRKHAVEALSWFGSKALPEITGLMADSNPEVAEAALEAAEQALSDMEDTWERFSSAAAYMRTFASNEDAISAFAGEMTSAANELIEPEDPDLPADVAKARQGREAVVSTLADMIEGGGKLAEEARDAYSFITGEDWISREEAAKWAADPDNYEAPET